jgi:hypothetical protein
MPFLQVYVPDDLYERLKVHGLSPSELHHEAVRAEVRRQDLLKAADAHLVDLVSEIGEPTQEQVARAEAIARRIRERSTGARRMVADGEARAPAEWGMPDVIPDLTPDVESLADVLIADRNRERNR